MSFVVNLLCKIFDHFFVDDGVTIWTFGTKAILFRHESRKTRQNHLDAMKTILIITVLQFKDILKIFIESIQQPVVDLY